VRAKHVHDCPGAGEQSATKPHVDELAASAEREIRAWTYAWQQDWESATRVAVDIFENLTASALRPYRALWLYLGSAWSALAATDPTSAAAHRSAELLRKAHGAAVGTTWLKEIQPLPDATYDSDPLDEAAVDSVIALLTGRLRSAAKFERESATMLANLNQDEVTKYEQGLVALGDFLGAESFKPPGQGRADAAWLWSTLWITVEAKSEQKSQGMLSMDYVRKANTQLASLASDRGDELPPEGSISVPVLPALLSSELSCTGSCGTAVRTAPQPVRPAPGCGDLDGCRVSQMRAERVGSRLHSRGTRFLLEQPRVLPRLILYTGGWMALAMTVTVKTR
jgi:hypothetical protein